MSQGKSKTMPMQFFWGVEAVYYGIVQVVNPRNNTKYKVRFLVVKESLTPLLGLNATEKMSLLTVHKENFVSVVENLENDPANNYPDVFDNGLGKLPGKVHLQVDPACQPVILPARKVPVSVKKKIQGGT